MAMSSLLTFATFLYEQFLETPQWTPASPTRLAGRTAIVTGANNGLGFAAAIELAGLDPKLVIMAVRNASKGAAAKAELVKRSGIAADRVQVWDLDLASFASVSAFAARVNSELDRVDILLESAGVSFTSWKETDDKWEQVLQVNGIATGLLGVLLLPLLAKTATLPLEAGQSAFKPHLTIVCSEGHGLTAFKPTPAGVSLLDDLNNQQGNNAEQRYELSKLIDVFLARKISALHVAKGVVVNLVNPGLCESGFRNEMKGTAAILLDKAARTTECGARNLAWACENDTPPAAYVSVTSVRSTSRYSRSAAALKVESQLWTELVELWSSLDLRVKSIVG